VGVQPLATEGDETQIGYAGNASRDPEALDLERVAHDAVERATRLLGATKPPSAKLTILLEPRLAASLLGRTAQLAQARPCGRPAPGARCSFRSRGPR
jgi:PmbA protein